MALDSHGSESARHTFSDGRIAELDGVRGIAIAMVVAAHYFINTIAFDGNLAFWIRHLGSTLWSGVDLFFVLSGFLIGGILWDKSSSPGFLRVFYLRRILRIFPVYYAWLLFFLLLGMLGIAPHSPDENPIPLWSYFVYFQNIELSLKHSFGPIYWLGVTWSLGIEEQFYLFLPVFFVMLSRRNIVLMLLSLSVISYVFRYELDHRWQFLPPYWWDALFMGALAAYMVRSDWWREKIRAVIGWVKGAFVLLVGVAIYMTIRADFTFPVLLPVFNLLFFTLILLAVLSREGVLGKMLRVRLLRKLGAISYGLYLFHLGVCQTVHLMGGNPHPMISNWRDVGLTMAALLISLLLAVVSYRFFESPLIQFGHRYEYSPSTVNGSVSMAAASA